MGVLNQKCVAAGDPPPPRSSADSPHRTCMTDCAPVDLHPSLDVCVGPFAVLDVCVPVYVCLR